jgi:hypothetical protein
MEMKMHARLWPTSIAISVCIIITGCAAATPTPTIAVPTAAPTATPRPPTAIPPTATPAPEGDPAPEGLEEALQATKPVGSEPLTLLYQIEEDGAQATATYEVTSFWTIPGALRDSVSSFISTAPVAFETDPELESLQAVYLVTMYDEDRNESLEALLKVMVTRDTAAEVDWANVMRCELPDVVESVEVHPTEAESWEQMCSTS